MKRALMIIATLLVCAGLAQAGIRADLSGDAVIDFQTTMDMPFMRVGNLGNTGELSGSGAGGDGPDRVCGAVDYAYRIAKFEVTAGQYTEFLNAVAATDSYGLYAAEMWVIDNACKIERSGSSGSHTYSVAADWADRPVNMVSWSDAARFCNWLTNGMPTGAQDLTTTEDGSYFLNGGPEWNSSQVLLVTRKADARYVIPSEDEWYKAAYHKNDGVTGNYFDYPTSSDTAPSNDVLDPDPGNNACIYDALQHAIGSPYYRTEAGEFENSESPYGTFDMGGNIYEWDEALIGEFYRGIRGGAFYNDDASLTASRRGGVQPSYYNAGVGSRRDRTWANRFRRH